MLFCFFTIFFSIYKNVFHVLTEEKWKYAENEFSLTLMYGKLLASNNSGIFSHGGFPGFFYVDTWEQLTEAKNNYIAKKKFSSYHYQAYTSQIGGQGIFYSFLDKISPNNKVENIAFFEIINSTLLSIALTLFLVWCLLNFGFLVSIITYFFILLSPWLMMYGKDIWWTQWIFLFPFSVLLVYFHFKKKSGLKNYYILIFTLVFLKLFVNGFEFITTFLVATCIPFILYHFKNFRSIRFLFRAAKDHIISIFLAFTASLLIIFQQFYILKGSYRAGLDHLINAYHRRSSGGYSYPDTNTTMNTLKHFKIDILYRYMGNNALELGFLQSHLMPKIPFGLFFLLGLLCCIFIFIKIKKLRNLALIAKLSFLAPASWLIIFREHGHVHTHVDFMIWYFPYLLFCFLLIGLTFQFIINKNNLKTPSFL